MRHDTIRFLVEEVLNGKVGELEPQRTHETGSTPSERKLDLVARFGLQLVRYVHRSFFGIGLNVRHEPFLVEVSHLRQLTQRTHDVRLRIELSRLRIEFTPHYMLVHTRVADDVHLVDGSRLAFVHAHLKIDGVILHVYLHRLDVEEQISAVGIEFAHRIVVSRQTVIQRLEVIDIAGLDAQRGVQELVRIHGVAYPFDRTDIVFVAFAHRHIDIHTRRVFGIRHHAVRHDIGVAITVLVVFLDDRRFVFLVFLGHEFLSAEEVDDVVIIRLLHRLVDLQVGQGFVAGNVNLAHFGLGLAVHADQHAHITRTVRIFLLDHMHFGVVESFLCKVFLDDGLRMVLEVRRHLRTLLDTRLHLQVLFLAFLQALVPHFADTRTLLQRNHQPYLTAFYLLRFDLHAGEQALLPEPLDGFRYLVAGHFYLVTDSQAGETDQHKILVVVCAFHFDAGYLVGLASHAVLDLLSLQRPKDKEQKTKDQYVKYLFQRVILNS